MTIEEKKYLEINTDGWTDVSCDKCGSCTSYSPEVKFEDMKCMVCMPEMSFDEWKKLHEEIK